MLALNGLVGVGEPGPILPGDVNEVWWMIIAFGTIAFLLVKFAGPPVARGFRARTERIERELGVADAARAEALAEAERIQASVANADVEADRIVAEAREAAAQLGASLRERADQEAVDLRARAASDIEAQKAQAIADLRAEVADLARGAAEAVVRHNLDDATQTALIEDYINKVGS